MSRSGGRLRVLPRCAPRIVAVGTATIACGFAIATVRTALISHPVQRYAASGVTITGCVELREESQHTDRFVLRVDHIEGPRLDTKLQRVRLTVKRGAITTITPQTAQGPLQRIDALMQQLRDAIDARVVRRCRAIPARSRPC
jgi:hypothetical protein